MMKAKGKSKKAKLKNRNQIFSFHFSVFTFLSLCLCATAVNLQAQSGEDFQITQSSVGSGGQSAGGNFSVTGTAGQPTAGVNSSGGAFGVRGGFWAFQAFAPTSAQVSLGGRVFSGKGLGIIRRTQIILLDTTTGVERSTQTNERGFYRFDELEVGRFYVVRAASRNFTFTPDSHFISLTEDRDDVNFTGARQLQN